MTPFFEDFGHDHRLSQALSADHPVVFRYRSVLARGVAGIVAAYLLQQQHQVSLFEKNDYLGGHTHTIEITQGADAGQVVDTGFIVLNDATYPQFQRFLARLGVTTREADMSFGFQCRRSGLVYAGNDLNGLFAQRRNLIRPTFWAFLLEIVRFCRRAQQDLASNSVAQITLGEYLRQGRFSPFMVENYLLPMAAAIWSTPTLQAVDFPAESFLRFFNNHGLLSLRNRPQWRTVVGGSFSYVKAFQRDFRGQIQLDSAVQKVTREPDGVVLRFSDGRVQRFDQVVMACHADQSLRLLGDPSADEQRLLSPWRYQLNHTVLHTDIRLLPERKPAWSAWNFTRETNTDDRREVFVTYYMNRLQGLEADRHYCVTLNHREDFAPDTVIDAFDYEHPQYNFPSLSAQSELPQLNGRRNSWFCGSYFGYGFHEDAVRSAVAVAQGFGIEL